MVHAWGRNTASWASRCSFPPRPVAKHNARYILVCLSLQYSRILTNETVSASLEVIRRARRSFRPREGAPPPGEGRSSGLKQSRRGQERAAAEITEIAPRQVVAAFVETGRSLRKSFACRFLPSFTTLYRANGARGAPSKG